ncbi:MAG: alpha-L-arabinofuranosidase C-terminal domain-containing protein, partial [Armatimonadota bacterium]
LDPNGFGTDEFLQLCRDVGAEPLIVFNIGQDDATESFPEHFQDCLNWIEYCNGPADSEWGGRRAQNGHPEPYNVVHWELGNETWRLGTDELCRRVKILSAAIRERWPDLVLWVCGSGGHNRDWNQKMLDGAAEAFDVLSVHHYQWGPSYEQRMAGALSYVRFLRETGEQIKQSANPDMRIGVTEWNLQTTSLETGLWAALFLMGCEQEPMVTYAAPALFIRNTDAPAWDNAFINIDHYRSYPAPNYLAMKLLHDTFGTEVLEVEVDTVTTEVQGFGEMAWLQASAVRDPDTGAVHVRLVNLHPRQPSVTEVELPRAFPKATLRTMTGPELDSRNTLDEQDIVDVTDLPCPPPARTITLKLPPHSVSVLSLTP